MRSKNTVLAVDIGTSTLKVGEFEFPSDGSIQLNEFACREYEEEITEGTRSAVISDMLRRVLQEHNFTSRKTLLTVSGQSVFTRFVKLPPVAEEEGRVRQIVEFEARQNVPFPLEEVTWSYQLLSTPDVESLEVMFVVIKNEILEDISYAVESVGLDLELIDVAPTACYNAARANGVGDEECSVVLDIGCRSTNLLFADRERFFSRTIPIAGHSISQQIAKEFGIDFEEAEELKKRHAFVALGGVYEEPESEVAASVSKIVRNVMTRLHGEVNRSINVYRAQKKGNKPVHFYLAGGSSIMVFTDRFFEEKLNMDVQYLNPLQVVTLGPNIDKEQLQDAAHMFSQTVGLALRYRSRCPIEVSLVPKAIKQQKIFRRKKYYLAASMLCVLLALLFQLVANRTTETQYRVVAQNLSQKKERLTELRSDLNEYREGIKKVRDKHKEIESLLGKQQTWPHLLNELQRLTPSHLWLSKIEPLTKLAGESDEGGREGSGRGRSGRRRSVLSGDSERAAPDGGDSESGSEFEKIVGLKVAGQALAIRPEMASKAENSSTEGEGSSSSRGGGMFRNGSEESEADQDGEGSEDANAEASGQSSAEGRPPAEAFLYNLKHSELFKESSKTNIITYSTSRDYPNLSEFVIQAELENPVEE